MERIIQILNEQGVHARPASILSKTASKFKSNISIVKGSKVANGKSIINIMGLGLKKGEEIKIIVEGADEKEAMEALVREIDNRFGEI